MSGFERRTRKKKETILEAARELFFTKGVDSPTISEIAAKAGVSPVSIYNYFSSKEGLLEIVIREHLEKSINEAEKILKLTIPFKDKIERFLSLGDGAKDSGNEELLKSIDWKSPGIQKIYNRFVEERQIPFLIEFIEIGKEEGAIDQGLSTDAVLAYFNANMMIYQDENLLKKGRKYLVSLSHLFFYGLLGK